MTETVLDQLVVKVRADADPLKNQLSNLGTEFSNFDRLTRKTTTEMSRAFENFAKTGEISFAGLKNAALSSLSDIASAAINSGLNQIFGGSGQNNTGGIIGSLIGGLFGRAGGGTVAPSRPYMVGERGPELFVPQTPGRVISHDQLGTRQGGNNATTNITINMTNSAGGTSDNSTRSAGQIATAVRRAVERAGRDQ